MLRIPVLVGLLTLFAPALIAASPVGVYLDFDESPSKPAMEAMRKEASRLLGRVGIRIAWRLVSENQGNEPFERLVVVKLTGECACRGFLPRTRETLVLGTTAVDSGRVLPFSQVRCDAVRRVLPEIEYAADRRVGDAALGRVLGRVVAHELYHAVLGTVHHAASGLAKGFQTTVDLTSGDISFDGAAWELQPAVAKQSHSTVVP
jgi:hypothetical protein